MCPAKPRDSPSTGPPAESRRRRDRLAGLAALAALTILLYTLKGLRRLCPRWTWLSRIEETWTHLWMR